MDRQSVRKSLKKSTAFRIVVMGAGGSGKSALVRRFVDGSFPSSYVETVEDSYSKEYEKDGQTMFLDIIDTSGSIDFPAMRDLNIRKANKIILTYEVGDMKSFAEVKRLYEIVKSNRDDYDEIPITIVGTKVDLKPDTEGYKDENVEAFLRSIPNSRCSHILTSARLSLNVRDAFGIGLEQYFQTSSAVDSFTKFLQKSIDLS